MGAVSFDLYAFPAPGPGTGPEARQLLETAGVENRRFDHDTAEWFPRPGPEMATFMDELERRWPSLEGDPDGRPWASLAIVAASGWRRHRDGTRAGAGFRSDRE